MFLAAGLCLLPLHASAQDRVDGGEYRATIDEALAEYAAQNYPEARTLFARAHSLYPNARTLRGLGAVSFELRQYSQCVSLLEQALSSRERPLDEPMRTEVTRLLARARGFVGQLRISIEPSHATVTVDGEEPTPVSDQPLQLDVGTHQLDFAAPHFVPERRSFSVEGGVLKTLKITLREPTSGPPAASAPVSSQPAGAHAGHSPAKFVSLGATIAVGAVTGLAVGMREKYAREIQDTCAGHSVPCDDLQSTGKRWRATAIVGGAVASVLAVTTFILFGQDRSRESSLGAREEPRASTSRVARALGACDLGLLSPGLSCKTHF